MQLRSRNVLLAITVPLVLFAGYQTIKHGIIGDFGTGSSAAAEVPYVGERLKALDATGPVAYSYKCHPHGGGGFSISGMASRDAIDRFCAASDTSLSEDGTNIQAREEIVGYLQENFSGSSVIRKWLATGTDSAMVLFCYGGRFHKLYGVWDPDSKRFAIWLQLVEDH